jgi:hypothetical protein
MSHTFSIEEIVYGELTCITDFGLVFKITNRDDGLFLQAVCSNCLFELYFEDDSILCHNCDAEFDGPQIISGGFERLELFLVDWVNHFLGDPLISVMVVADLVHVLTRELDFKRLFRQTISNREAILDSFSVMPLG